LTLSHTSAIWVRARPPQEGRHKAAGRTLSGRNAILFTGASSSTGCWFVCELVAAGHEVVAACHGDGRYEGLPAERIRMVREPCETRFGSDNFLALMETVFDVLRLPVPMASSRNPSRSRYLGEVPR
jgi:nucleoside-diphosphate-sugar epimerase